MLNHQEQQALVESILAKYEDNMALVMANVSRYIDRLLLTDGINEATALNFDVAFNRILTETGYFDAVNDFIDNDFDDMFELIKTGFAGGGFAVTYSQEDLEKFMALKSMQVDRFANLASMSGNEIKQNLYKYVLSDYSVEDIQKQIAIDLKGTPLERYHKTIARTSIKDFQEAVIDIKAQGIESVWLYIGVSDSKTRDFCNCILNKKMYFDDSAKSSMKSDPKRAYNCRHRFRPVSEEFAIENGYTKADGSVC